MMFYILTVFNLSAIILVVIFFMCLLLDLFWSKAPKNFTICSNVYDCVRDNDDGARIKNSEDHQTYSNSS